MLKYTPTRFAEHIAEVALLHNNAKYARGERDIRIVSKSDVFVRNNLTSWVKRLTDGEPQEIAAEGEEKPKKKELTLVQLKGLMAAEGEKLYEMHEKQLVDVTMGWPQLLRDRLPVTPENFARLETYRKIEGLLDRF